MFYIKISNRMASRTMNLNWEFIPILHSAEFLPYYSSIFIFNWMNVNCEVCFVLVGFSSKTINIVNYCVNFLIYGVTRMCTVWKMVQCAKHFNNIPRVFAAMLLILYCFDASIAVLLVPYFPFALFLIS